jgi:transposase
MAPLRHLSAKLLCDRISSEWEPSMGEVTTIGLDLAKLVFQVHGVDAEGATVLRKQLRRAQVLGFFSRLRPCLVGLEACATAHYWARELRALGHDVRLMPAQYVKAYIKRNKHDAADLASIPGIGPIIATAIATTVADPTVFRSGREFAAWLGLVPRQNSTGGKTRLGGITKRGNRYLRRLLINGASANLLRSKATKADPWVIGLRRRRPPRSSPLRWRTRRRGSPGR